MLFKSLIENPSNVSNIEDFLGDLFEKESDPEFQILFTHNCNRKVFLICPFCNMDWTNEHETFTNIIIKKDRNYKYYYLLGSIESSDKTFYCDEIEEYERYETDCIIHEDLKFFDYNKNKEELTFYWIPECCNSSQVILRYYILKCELLRGEG